MLLRNFLIGCIVGLVLFAVGKLINFLIEKYLKVPSEDSLIGLGGRKGVIKELAILSIAYGILFAIYLQFSSFIGVVIFFSILLSYGFIIKPYLYAMRAKNRDLETENRLLRELGIHAKVFVHEKNFTNALTFGALPFSSIIIISKDLYQNLDSNDLFAIVLHELGHVKKNHMLYLYIYNIVMAVTYSNVVTYILRYNDVFPTLQFLLILMASGGALGLLWYFLIAPGMRFFEYRADAFAARILGSEQYCKMLNNLETVTKGAVSSYDFYHPSLKNRLRNAAKSGAIGM